MTHETKQKIYWQRMAELDPDCAVIDPTDRVGHKNRYICRIRDDAFFSALRCKPLESKVLDFGCGTGGSTASLIKLGFNVKGVDIAPALLEHAIRRCPQAEFFLANSEAIPLEDGSVDAAVTYVVLSYIVDNEALIATLKEMYRVLKPGGRLVLIEQTRRRQRIVEQGLKIQRSLDEWQHMISTAGFINENYTILRHGRFLTTPLIKLGMISEYCWPLLMRLEKTIARRIGVFPGDYAEVLFEATK